MIVHPIAQWVGSKTRRREQAVEDMGWIAFKLAEKGAVKSVGQLVNGWQVDTSLKTASVCSAKNFLEPISVLEPGEAPPGRYCVAQRVHEVSAADQVKPVPRQAVGSKNTKGVKEL